MIVVIRGDWISQIKPAMEEMWALRRTAGDFAAFDCCLTRNNKKWIRSANGDGVKEAKKHFSLPFSPLIASMSKRDHCCTNTPFIHTIDVDLTFKFCPPTTTVCSVYSYWECVGRPFTYKASAEADDGGWKPPLRHIYVRSGIKK